DDARNKRLDFPPLPQVAVELGRLASSSDPDLGEATRLVERDNQLAGRVVQVASSAAMGGRAVTDLQGAVVRLGVNGLRDLAFAITMGRVFRCPPLDDLVKQQMQHSFVVAIGTARACKMLGLSDKYGFLCGLFHDIGHLAVLIALARYGRDDPEMLKPEFASTVADQLHGSMGPWVLKSWGMHNMVVDVAAHHHESGSAGAAMPMCQAVAAVDAADGVELEVDTAQARAAALCQLPVGYEAGLSGDQLVDLAEVVHIARNDDVVARMMG
ncbi:MAG: HDOD domain-containing protein, partial [Nannocystaceae bacterium]|nr:HDOD domain-containing protein [Nannocystaceae bacterium]